MLFGGVQIQYWCDTFRQGKGGANSLISKVLFFAIYSLVFRIKLNHYILRYNVQNSFSLSPFGHLCSMYLNTFPPQIPPSAPDRGFNKTHVLKFDFSLISMNIYNSIWLFPWFQRGGSAFESGLLRCGHLILEVNGRNLRGMSHCEAVKVIADAFQDTSSDQLNLIVSMDPQENSWHPRIFMTKILNFMFNFMVLCLQWLWTEWQKRIHRVYVYMYPTVNQQRHVHSWETNKWIHVV